MICIGSLFSGYGGLDLAVEQVTGARVDGGCRVVTDQASLTADNGDGLDLHKVGPKPGYMESIGTIRKARKPITCDSCGETIQPGDEYVRHALPPSSDGNKGWWVIRACGWWTDDCRRFWEIDKRDLSGEPHVLPV